MPYDPTPKKRHEIKNMFARLKDWRRIATRNDRCAHTFILPFVFHPSFFTLTNES